VYATTTTGVFGTGASNNGKEFLAPDINIDAMALGNESQRSDMEGV
jgi:hypothetical protein